MEDHILKTLYLIEASNPDICICVTDQMLDFPGPNIVYVNKKWKEITGYSDEEAIGKSPRILQGPKSCKETLSKLKANLKEGKKFEGTSINYRKNGSEFNITWITIEPMFGCFISLQKVHDEQEIILELLKEIEVGLVEKLKEYI